MSDFQAEMYDDGIVSGIDVGGWIWRDFRRIVNGMTVIRKIISKFEICSKEKES